MILRPLLAAAILALGIGGFCLFRYAHMRHLARLTGAGVKARLLYFRSDNCYSCAAQARFLDQVAGATGDRLIIEQIDAEKEADKAARYAVFTLPTTLIIDKSGKVRHLNYGLTPAGTLSRQLEGVL